MPTVSGVTKAVAKGVYVTTWSRLQPTVSIGSAILAAHLPDKTVHVYGNAGATGFKVRIQGRNATGGTWVVLNDPQGNALLVTAAKAEAILENPTYIRPILVSGSSPTASVVVEITSRGQLR